MEGIGKGRSRDLLLKDWIGRGREEREKKGSRR